MKRKLVIIIIFLIFISSYSCIFNPNNDGKFKEKINHDLVFSKFFDGVATEGYVPGGLGNSFYFDGNYFYFGALNYQEYPKLKSSVMKIDLNGNILWNTKIENDNNTKEIAHVKKINNKIYIITSDGELIRKHWQLHILDAENGFYYKTYYLNDIVDCISDLSPDEYNGIIYFPIEYYKGEDQNNFSLYDLHIFCIDANSDEIINERVFENFSCMTQSGENFIHNGKIYLRFSKKILFVLDCVKVSNNGYTNEQCIIKDIAASSKPSESFVNILKVDNKIICYYRDENEDTGFICYDENNNYQQIWKSIIGNENNPEFCSPLWAEMISIGNKFIVPAGVDYISCYSLDNGKFLWIKDASVYVNDSDFHANIWNNGEIIENRWYVQPILSNSTVIFYDINSGEKVGRLEDILMSNGDHKLCWAVGNKLYLMAGCNLYFYCWQISTKSKEMHIIPIIIIFTFLLCFLIYFNCKKKKKEEKEKIKENIEQQKESYVY